MINLNINILTKKGFILTFFLFDIIFSENHKNGFNGSS